MTHECVKRVAVKVTVTAILIGVVVAWVPFSKWLRIP